MLDTMGQNYKSDKTTVTLGNVKAVLNSKRAVNSAKALGVSQLALILAACGSDTATTTATTTLLSLTKSGDNYSASNVTGFSVADQTSATFDVADAATNAYSIKLDATGTGTLHFDFADATDEVVLQAGSKVAGFTTLKVTDGSIDATNADLSSITRVEVASGIKITLAQIKTIPTIVSNSATGKIEVEVASEAEATELVSLMTAGTVSVFGAANPIDLVAAPAAPATLTADVLTAKETETVATLKAVSEAPAVVVEETPVVETPVTPVVPVTPVTPTAPVSTVEEAIRFTMSGDASGNFTPGFYNGNVTVTASGDNYVVTPASGTAVETPTSGVTSFVVNSITMNAEAAVLDGETITGTGNVALTKLEGDAAADLSLITNTGTRTVAVSDDVTFTGNLGTFTTTVSSGKTLTADVDMLTGKTIDGAGTVALTDLDTLLSADLSGITSTTFTAAFNADGTFTGDLGAAAVAVASTKTLTTTVMKAAGKDIDGAGNVILTGGVTDDAVLTNIDNTGTLAFDSNTTAITASKTLTLDAVQASKATSGITGTGNLTISDDGGAANSTIVSTVTKAGVITIDAGTGNDTINIGISANLEADDTIDGGGGTDELKIIADSDTTGAIADDLVDIDTITLVADSNETLKLTLQYTSANTDAITITGAALTGGTAAMTLVATDAEVDGNLTVIDTAGADTITTGDGDDTITVTEVTGKADAVTGDAGTDTLVFGTATIDVNSNSVVVDLRAAQSDQIASVNTNFFTGNQTGIENFNFSSLTLTNAAAPGVNFTNLDTTTDVATTSLVGSAETTDKITDIADGVDMTPITNTGIEVLDLANGGVTIDMDTANFTNVTALTGGTGTDVVKLAEAAAFDLSAITTFAGITTFNMAVTSKVATSLKLNQTGSNDFGSSAAILTGDSGTAQTLSLTDSGDAVIVITGITNANVETISLVDDDDDLTIDVANMQHVTAFNGVSGGSAELLILTGASTFDFSTVTVSDLTITGTDSSAQVIESGIGADTINFGGTTAGDTLVYGAVNQRGDTVTNFQEGNNKDILNLKAATTYKGSTVEGIKAGTLANFDSWTEISATSQHGAVVLSDTNLTASTALVTAFNATDFDTTADASVIVVWEDSDNGSGAVEMGVLTNAASANGDDVTYSQIAIFSDIADTTGFHAFNFDVVA